jgi:hypothetical protein
LWEGKEDIFEKGLSIEALALTNKIPRTSLFAALVFDGRYDIKLLKPLILKTHLSHFC